MSKKIGKAIDKMKKGFQKKAEGLKERASEIRHHGSGIVHQCKVTPDVCIVRQTRRNEGCLSCRSFVR